MYKVFAVLAAAMLAAPALAAPVGADAARCRPGAPGAALMVDVTGLKSLKGTVRVQLYGASPNDFLAKGKKLRRIDVPVGATAMTVCLALPSPGRYAVAVRHDANGNRKNDWNDGGGFSRNPRISIGNLEPEHSQVAINAGGGIQRVPVVMQYRQGLSIGPIRKSGG